MKWLILPCLCLVAIASSGCAEMARMNAEAEAYRQQQEIATKKHQLMIDRMQCEQFGLTFGTKAFADCMTQANNARIEQSYRDAELQARQQEIDSMLAIQREEREERQRRERERTEEGRNKEPKHGD